MSWNPVRFLDNPVLQREIRSRFRRRRSFIVLFTKLVLLSALIPIFYESFARRSSINPTEQTGTVTFTTLIMVEASILLLLTAAMASTAFTVEKEQRTFDLLVATRLTPFEIIVGKLLASLYWIYLFILASAPILFLCVFFGGLSPRAVLHSLLYLMFLSTAYGIFGMAISLRVRRTVTAISLSLLLVLLVNAGPILLVLLFTISGVGPDESVVFVALSSTPYLPLSEMLWVEVRKEIAQVMFLPSTLANILLLSVLSGLFLLGMIRRLRRVSDGEGD